MRESSVQLVEDAVNLIERQLNEPLGLDELAQLLYISKYHLHHLFKALTGETLMSYVRGRRLSRSLNELLCTNKTIYSIAQEYCFNYEQSYERAFKNKFGKTPTDYRSAPHELSVVHRFDTSSLKDFDHGIFAQPRFCVLPHLMFAGMRTTILLEPPQPTAANKAALRFCNIERKKIADRENEYFYYGFTHPVNDRDKSYDYLSCVEILKKDNVPVQFECFELPSHMYAVFKYVGFHSADLLSDYNLDEIYNYIVLDWSLKTNCVRNEDYIFERIDLRVCKPSYCEAEIYVPVN